VKTPSGIEVQIPGRGVLALLTLAIDFTGTLATDGSLVPDVEDRLRALAARLRILVLTADTFGTVTAALAGLPVEIHVVTTGEEKAAILREAGAETSVAVGNGRNDVAMFRLARLTIAVVGPEGAAGDLIRVADVVARDAAEALDLLLHPRRLRATLRD
jgi:soluble P-type ATPase